MQSSDGAALPLPGSQVRLDPESRVVTSALVGLASAMALVRYGAEPQGFIAAFLLASLVILSAFDLRFRLLPNRIVLPAAALVLVAQAAFFPGQALEWAAAAVGTAAFFLVPRLVNPDSVGMGDVKLGLLLGAGLGSEVVGAVTIGSFAAVPVALWIVTRKGRGARGTAIPFGPFLALGAAVTLLS